MPTIPYTITNKSEHQFSPNKIHQIREWLLVHVKGEIVIVEISKKGYLCILGNAGFVECHLRDIFPPIR